MKAIINEKKMAERILETDEIYENLWETKVLLIKYYHSLGNSTSQIKDYVMKFIKKNAHKYLDDDYNAYIDEKSTDRAIRIYTKPQYKLSDVDYITVSKTELEKIKAMKDMCAEKLAFVLLVMCKLKNLKLTEFNSWIGNKTKEFYKHSKNRGGKEYQEKMIGRLYRNGIIDLPSHLDVSNISLDVKIAEENTGDDNVELRLYEDDLREVVLSYVEWRGGGIIKCQECGIRVETNSNSRKYCKDCASDKERSRKKNWKKNQNAKVAK